MEASPLREVKLQYVVRAADDTPNSRFRAQILARLVPALLAREPRRLSLALTLQSPRLSVIPFRRRPLALVSLWERPSRASDWPALLSRHGHVDGYWVTESIPRDYHRDWPDGDPTPGVGLLTLFSRPPGLDRQAFIRAWHGGHTPLSLEIHPIWRYERNVVEEPAVEGSPPLDGIVEEHFRRRSDLLNPVRFFGGAARMLPNMVRVALDIRRFIHLPGLESYLVSEHSLRS